MILQALCDYYERKADELPRLGFERKDIAFVIVLSEDGRFRDLEDTRDGEGKRKVARSFVVPQGIKKTSGIAANLLWDNVAYTLGEVSTAKAQKLTLDQLEQERARTGLAHHAFIRLLYERFPVEPRDIGVQAVIDFLERGDRAGLRSHPLWQEMLDTPGNVSFRLVGDAALVCQRPAVVGAVATAGDDGAAASGVCLVTGNHDVVARLHPSVQGVRDAQSSGASLVSFNLPAFNSFGKEQSFNAPVGRRAVFAYTTALSHLLRKGSRQSFQIGDATTVFWAEKAHPLEDNFADWFDVDNDDPDRGTEAVRALYAAPYTGQRSIDEDGTRFFVLGLAPNAARLAVRFWHCTTVGELARYLRQHFDDLALDQPAADAPPLALRPLLAATAVAGDYDNVPPKLAGDVMRAVLNGTPYPRTLLQAAVGRTRAERFVGRARAALIKAVLRRDARFRNRESQEVDVSLDPANRNPGYRLGRLFAVLERIQELANPGINATIRDRFYGSASAHPATAFPHLLKLKNHHLSKLDRPQLVTWLEKCIGEVMDGLDDLPRQLNLEDQGRFAVGYYHQRQALFSKNTTNQNEIEGESA